MPTASREHCADEFDVDMRLVTTYIPLMILILRSIAMCVFCEVFYRIFGPRQNLLIIIVLIMYADASSWQRDRMNRIVGFLCPVALCIVTTTNHTLCSPVVDETLQSRLPLIIIYWTLQVLWPVSTAYYFSAVIFSFQKPREVYLITLWSACLGVHCYLLLGGFQSTGEIMLRCIVYYMTAMLFYHSKCKLAQVDRNTHHSITMHVCLHFLFVDVYIMICSVTVFSILFWYIFFNRTASDIIYQASIPKTRQDEDLLTQLRAAKSGIGHTVLSS